MKIRKHTEAKMNVQKVPHRAVAVFNRHFDWDDYGSISTDVEEDGTITHGYYVGGFGRVEIIIRGNRVTVLNTLPNGNVCKRMVEEMISLGIEVFNHEGAAHTDGYESHKWIIS